MASINAGSDEESASDGRITVASVLERIKEAGFFHAEHVIHMSAVWGIPLSVLLTVLDMESKRGNNWFGHDSGACFSFTNPRVNVVVTETLYRQYEQCLRNGGKTNGVGPMQLTYRAFQVRADEQGGCWNPEVNISVGAQILADHKKTSPTWWEVFKRYNGKASYADEATKRMDRDWSPLVASNVLVAQMGHVGRPPNPGSRGTAGEQDFSRGAVEVLRRLMDAVPGWSIRVIPADVPDAMYAGDAFVSFHCDGSTDPNIRRASVGYQSSEGKTFATAWKAAWKALGYNGGWNSDNYTNNLAGYYGVTKAVARGNRRAIILEHGHLTNPTDRAYLQNPTGYEKAAVAVMAALGIDVVPIQPPDENGEEIVYSDCVYCCISLGRAAYVLPNGTVLEVTDEPKGVITDDVYQTRTMVQAQINTGDMKPRWVSAADFRTLVGESA